MGLTTNMEIIGQKIRGIRKEILRAIRVQSRGAGRRAMLLEEAVSMIRCGVKTDQGSWEPSRDLGRRGWWEPTPGAENLR